MPKLGMEPIRRKALIGATIAEIGTHGSLAVTVGQIAKRAGVSSALAHHYFGGKEDLILASMRHLLMQLGVRVVHDLRGVSSGRERISVIICASFAPEQFSKLTISAWLNFYVMAQGNQRAARLLRVYTHRLRSNLIYGLAQIVPPKDAREIADGIGAMIDGVYLRQALKSSDPIPSQAIEMVEKYVDTMLAGIRH